MHKSNFLIGGTHTKRHTAIFVVVVAALVAPHLTPVKHLLGRSLDICELNFFLLLNFFFNMQQVNVAGSRPTESDRPHFFSNFCVPLFLIFLFSFPSKMQQVYVSGSKGLRRTKCAGKQGIVRPAGGSPHSTQSTVHFECIFSAVYILLKIICTQIPASGYCPTTSIGWRAQSSIFLQCFELQWEW